MSAHAIGESTGVENRKLGMWFFLSSEFLFFGALITNFMLFKGRELAEGIPDPHAIYDIPFTSVSSFVLLMSSLTMVLAHHALHEGDQRGARTWLLSTAALGLTFLAGQYFEFTEFVLKGASLSAAPVWSSFFLMTGFHGAHVLIGTMFLFVCLIRALKGHFTPERHVGFEAAAWYWHFVDVVWLFLFAAVYIWGQ